MRTDAACLAVIGLLAAGAAPANATPAVLADWPFDGTTADAGGNGLDGSPGDGSARPSWIGGHDGGSALEFDGSDYVSVADNPILEPAHVAVDAWVKRSASPGRWRYVLSKGSVGCERSAYGLYSGWSSGMAFYVSNDREYVISPEVAPALVWDGRWHHVVGAYDGAHVRLWLDGAEVGAGTPASPPIAYGVGSKGVRIGAYNGDCDLGFVGGIDDVRVWNDTPPMSGTPLPAIEPVPGTPTRVAVSGGGGSSSGGDPKPASGSGTASGCLRVSLNPRTIHVKRRVRVRATVRRAAKPVAGVHVVITGAGINAKARTNHKGTATIVVKARKRGPLKARVRGQKPSCPAATVRAR
jgi:hypothetical protein